MAIAFDAANSVSNGGNYTPSGTPRGLILFMIDNGGTTASVTNVTYGGVAMTEIDLSPLEWTASLEDAVIQGFFLGSSIPTGTQTVSWSGGASLDSRIMVSFTASADTEIVDTSTTSATSGTNPTLSLGGDSAGVFGVAALQSGLGTSSQLTPGAGMTQLEEIDHGAQLTSVIRTTNLTTTTPSFTMGWTAVASSYAALGATIREVAGGGGGGFTMDAGMIPIGF